jgi:integrase
VVSPLGHCVARQHVKRHPLGYEPGHARSEHENGRDRRNRFAYRRRRWRDITRDPHLIAFLRGLRSFETNATPPIPIVWVVMAIEACEPTFRGRRDAALLAIMLVTGALPAALCALDRCDYRDEGDHAILRFGDRSVSITAGRTGIVLGAVHAHCRRTGDGPLFRSADYAGNTSARRMDVKSIYNVVRTRLRRAGAPEVLCRTRAIRAGFIDAARASGIGNVALMRRLGLRSAPWQARWR